MPGADRLPPLLEFGGERFARKNELHATLAGSRVRRAAAELYDAARGLEFTVVPSGIRLLIRKDARRSLIELVEVEGLEAFCARLQTPVPPAHVTLFTEPGGGGIAISTLEELNSWSVPASLALDPSPWRLDDGGAILGG